MIVVFVAFLFVISSDFLDWTLAYTQETSLSNGEISHGRGSRTIQQLRMIT